MPRTHLGHDSQSKSLRAKSLPSTSAAELCVRLSGRCRSAVASHVGESMPSLLRTMRGSMTRRLPVMAAPAPRSTNVTERASKEGNARAQAAILKRFISGLWAR